MRFVEDILIRQEKSNTPMTLESTGEDDARQILRKFEQEKRWFPRGFAERAEILSHEHATCLRNITRYITVNESSKSLELSESKYQTKTAELRKDFGERGGHTPNHYVVDEDKYLVPETHDTGTCSKCNGTEKVDCPKCGSTGKMNCPDCDGRGEISKKEPCKKCEGTGEVNSESCSRCQGDGEEVVTEACTRCGKEGIVTCNKCSGRGEITCQKCDGEGMTHEIEVLSRNYTPKEQVEYEGRIAPKKLVEDIRGTHVETKNSTDSDSGLKHQTEIREIEIHKIKYKFPRRLIGSSDRVWEIYKIENSYRCEDFPSKLNPLYL